MRYVGLQDQAVCWISNNPIELCVEVPPELSEVTDEDLITNYIYRDGVWINKLLKPVRQNLKIAMIARYGINCGIATYTKYLCDAMRPLVQEIMIFSERSDCISSDDKVDNVCRCWEGQSNFIELLNAVAEYAPDVVYVQHEYGCFNNAVTWNLLIGHLSANWRTIVVLHSVYEHQSKLIFEAPCQEVIVHSKSAKTLLQSREVDHCRIHYIPHGCLAEQKQKIKFSMLGSDHVIFQYGFGFEYKGWEKAIEIIRALKDEYDDLVYIGIFNISKYSEKFNEDYYNILMTKIKQSGLAKHFVLLKGFRSDPILASYLSQAHIALFPYWNHPEWLVHGASGAVRMALACDIPTIVGDVPFFSEFKGHIPVCDTIEEYCNVICKIFNDPDFKEQIIEQTKLFVQERNWDRIAEWYLSCQPNEDFTAL